MSERRNRQRRRRRSVLRFDLRKAMFVLPNLFTISSVGCGFYAILLASGNPGPTQLYQATLAVFFGLFFDMADGRVARLTKTQSDFGVQLDSLADLVTFGVAPAVIVYRWGLFHMGPLGAFIAFTFVASGAIRLARFNVLASRGGGGPTGHFIGLPIPLAAGVLVTLVMFHQRTFAAPLVREANILVLVLVLSYLMVSNVRYRSFKQVRPTRRTLSIFALVTLTFVAIAWQISPTFALFSFFCAYVGLGLVEEVIFFRRRRAAGANSLAAGSDPATAPPAGGPESQA